jgi:NhaP-type Na+/H+ or K+/H+ antiporter
MTRRLGVGEISPALVSIVILCSVLVVSLTAAVVFAAACAAGGSEDEQVTEELQSLRASSEP